MYADDLAYVKPKGRRNVHLDMAQRSQKYKPIFLALNAKKSKWMLLSPGTKTPNIILAIDGAEIEKIDTVDLDRKIVLQRTCHKNCQEM
uniref:Reverse transcriptase domain-containing protein n=1 Tax=Acrobeloides nanus TaxID=290746 RepID=A0A914BVZ0_9BILA